MKEIVIISLGGSLIVPEKIDIKFLKEFKRKAQARLEEETREATFRKLAKELRERQEKNIIRNITTLIMSLFETA